MSPIADALTALLQARFALKAWVARIGFEHPNECWWGMRVAWFDQVDGELKGVGHPGLRGMPLPRGLPFPVRVTDAPVITCLPRTQVTPELAALDRALAMPGWSSEARDAVHALRCWVADAALWQKDLVAFYA